MRDEGLWAAPFSNCYKGTGNGTPNGTSFPVMMGKYVILWITKLEEKKNCGFNVQSLLFGYNHSELESDFNMKA